MDIKYDYKFLKPGVVEFFAAEGKKPVSHLYVNAHEKEFPFVQSMNTLKKYEGKGIMENLVKEARDFYWNVLKKKIRSSSYVDSDVKGYYEKLEKKGLVEKVLNDKGKWNGSWEFK